MNGFVCICWQRGRCLVGACALLLLLAACATPQSRPRAPTTIAPAMYPIKDGIKATVVGTPPPLRADLPDDVPITRRSLPPLVQRAVPPVLAYATPLQYTLAAQSQPAPLVFVIAGTGATAGSQKCRIMLRMLYAAGLSAACLPSPTSVNFMVGAADHPMPGYMPADVASLYEMMRVIRQDLADELQMTGYDLAGYSLGATQAAFIARDDARHGTFGFDRVLLVNPAVSVWSSVQRMDDLIKQDLPGGINGVPAFLASLLGELKDPLSSDKPLRFNRQLLFRAVQTHQVDHQQLAAVVGLVFRLALANMAFAADVLTDSGVIVPRSVQLGIADSLEPYMRASFELSFADYIDELLLPYWNRDGRSLSRRQLLAGASLRSMQSWLEMNTDIAVITNADDPILDDAGLAFLRTTFGDRATILPHGGHMGNLASRAVVHRIQDYFAP